MLQLGHGTIAGKRVASDRPCCAVSPLAEPYPLGYVGRSARRAWTPGPPDRWGGSMQRPGTLLLILCVAALLTTSCTAPTSPSAPGGSSTGGASIDSISVAP